MIQTSQPPLLQMNGIVKSFPGVRALSGVDLNLERGEVLALIGENGAGKSTLIKTLGGAHQPSEGEIQIDGKPVELATPIAAQRAGIGMIYQEFNLVPFLSARENIFLGRPHHRYGLINAAAERSATVSLFRKLEMDVEPDALVSSLSIAEQQAVEIAKSLITNAKILVMDEPTATLTSPEVKRLFEIVRELKVQGIGIIYVSHRLDEVLEIADRVMVLRDGEKIGDRRADNFSRREMIEMMVGREIEDEFPQRQLPLPTGHAVRLRVDNLCWRDRVDHVNFEVYAGEILGITGLVGAGRTEVARLIFGAEIPDKGALELDGCPLTLSCPVDAIRSGICLLTEDRKGQGLVLNHSARENFGLPNLDHFANLGVIDIRSESAGLSRFAEQLKIRMASQEQPAGTLSGGNQQKLVLAKWLERACQLVVIDEPTRGIDVGAKYEIYQLMRRLASQNKSIIMISSELTEILGMSDRILVMRQGRVAGVISDVAAATQRDIMELAAQ